MPDMPWRDAIIEVLRREGTAMHYTAIAERVVADGLRKAVGATPASTVNAVITTSLNSDAERSPFQRVARGEYVLRAVVEGHAQAVAVATPPGEPSDEVEGPIHAFGMFWDRDRVRWTNNPAVLGRQQIGADPVDMAGQRGVYLLYDGREVVYVGRCTDRPLGTRLYEHTYDRLRTRWNRFSWFGLCPVRDDGALGQPAGGQSSEQFIAAMEALLIEALEPGQNRRRGEGFSAVEFIQAEDPEMERAQLRAAIAQLQARL
jgi:hypothetical protein